MQQYVSTRIKYHFIYYKPKINEIVPFTLSYIFKYINALNAYTDWFELFVSLADEENSRENRSEIPFY